MIRNVTKLFSLQSFPPKQNVSFLDKKDIQVFKEREREASDYFSDAYFSKILYKNRSYSSTYIVFQHTHKQIINK